MSTAVARADAVESVLIGGDLSKLTPEQRTSYYQRVCDSLGLNVLTRPFEYIVLNGKLTLYARKDCTDQLRRVHGVSIGEPSIRFEDDWIIVAVSAKLPDGRTDADVGVVNRKDMRGDFGNALMKAVTKAKRRVTLSVCGLGMLDETEVEAVPDARPAPADPPKALPPQQPAADPAEGRAAFDALCRRKDVTWQKGALSWLARAFPDAGYTDDTTFEQVNPEHRKKLAEAVGSMKDKG